MFEYVIDNVFFFQNAKKKKQKSSEANSEAELVQKKTKKSKTKLSTGKHDFSSVDMKPDLDTSSGFLPHLPFTQIRSASASTDDADSIKAGWIFFYLEIVLKNYLKIN